MISVCSWKFLGKHTIEKPVLAKPAPKHPVAVLTSSPNANAATKDSCSRCQQGFFCSDHEQMRQTLNTPVQAQEEKIESLATPPIKKVVIDINQPQVCKNKGCGKTFKERDNHETACSYHPGPPIFHDRMKGWKCCDVLVKEFDEFMEIPPCSKGWHSNDQAV